MAIIHNIVSIFPVKISLYLSKGSIRHTVHVQCKQRNLCLKGVSNTW